MYVLGLRNVEENNSISKRLCDILDNKISLCSNNLSYQYQKINKTQVKTVQRATKQSA